MEHLLPQNSTAVFGTLGYIIAGIKITELPNLSLGYVYLPALLGVSITSIFAAKYGADLAHYFSQTTLKRLMAMWFFIISIYIVHNMIELSDWFNNPVLSEFGSNKNSVLCHFLVVISCLDIFFPKKIK